MAPTPLSSFPSARAPSDELMDDTTAMMNAIEVADGARRLTSPNPWVGAVVLSGSGEFVASGATEPVGGSHAEVLALRAAGSAARGGTLVVTLEPCSHHGRTPPCVDAIVAAGIAKVVVGVGDPDRRVAGRGVAALRDHGIDVVEGVLADRIAVQLAPYLHHRVTGRPFVVCKIATTLDGGTAAPDGTSRWITGDAARRDGHRLRAESDAIVVGAGTVRADDPALTVRHVEGRDPLRVVLGHAAPHARVQPCTEWHDEPSALLDELGRRGALQVLIEGGATVVRSFHDAGLIDRYVIYMAAALFGGSAAHPMLAGSTAPTINDVWRGRFVGVEPVGDDVRIDVAPHSPHPTPLRSTTTGDST